MLHVRVAQRRSDSRRDTLRRVAAARPRQRGAQISQRTRRFPTMPWLLSQDVVLPAHVTCAVAPHECQRQRGCPRRGGTRARPTARVGRVIAPPARERPGAGVSSMRKMAQPLSRCPPIAAVCACVSSCPSVSTPLDSMQASMARRTTTRRRRGRRCRSRWGWHGLECRIKRAARMGVHMRGTDVCRCSSAAALATRPRARL